MSRAKRLVSTANQSNSASDREIRSTSVTNSAFLLATVATPINSTNRCAFCSCAQQTCVRLVKIVDVLNNARDVIVTLRHKSGLALFQGSYSTTENSERLPLADADMTWKLL